MHCACYIRAVYFFLASMFLLVLFCESVGGRRHEYEAPANEAVHAVYVRVNVPLLNSVLVLAPDHIDHISKMTLSCS